MRREFEDRRRAGLKILSAVPGISVSKPDGAFYFYVTYPPGTSRTR